MRDNIFKPQKEHTLADYMSFDDTGRSNLGQEIPVAVYRLMEYSLREELVHRLGKENQIEIFRSAGYRAGEYFARNQLDLSLPFSGFIAQLEARFSQLKMGLIRIEEADQDSGRIILTVAEDADCAGLPMLGETVCNYDEGFLAGILASYTKRDYSVVETDCWATGDRVCRFQAEVRG